MSRSPRRDRFSRERLDSPRRRSRSPARNSRPNHRRNRGVRKMHNLNALPTGRGRRGARPADARPELRHGMAYAEHVSKIARHMLDVPAGASYTDVLTCLGALQESLVCACQLTAALAERARADGPSADWGAAATATHTVGTAALRNAVSMIHMLATSTCACTDAHLAAVRLLQFGGQQPAGRPEHQQPHTSD